MHGPGVCGICAYLALFLRRLGRVFVVSLFIKFLYYFQAVLVDNFHILLKMKCSWLFLDIQWMFLGLFLLFMSINGMENSAGQSTFSAISYHYTPSMLLSLRPSCLNSCQHTQYTFPERPKRKRGRKGGIKEKNRRRKAKPYLPTIVFGNTNSLNNKLTELSACSRHQYEYRDSSMLAFTETWFDQRSNDNTVSIDNF